MSKREPTIEQNSHFSAKTKEGQDVEFEATLKFYITPSGEVSLSVPGGRQSSTSATIVAPPSRENQQTDTSVRDRQPPNSQAQERPPPPDPNAGRRNVDQSDSGTRLQRDKRHLADDTIDRAFPRGPEPPSSECSIKQFIPDPCKAVDDALRSIKGFYNNLFSGPKCPPPTNTDYLKEDHLPLFEKSDKNYSEKSREGMDNKDNENKEMMENEQKYDM